MTTGINNAIKWLRLLILTILCFAFVGGSNLVKAEGEELKGSITIIKPSEVESESNLAYKIYKMLDLKYGEYTDKEGKEKGTYFYTIVDGWRDFFAKDEVKKYFEYDPTSNSVK